MRMLADALRIIRGGKLTLLPHGYVEERPGVYVKRDKGHEVEAILTIGKATEDVVNAFTLDLDHAVRMGELTPGRFLNGRNL
jgi:hypothetical protein